MNILKILISLILTLLSTFFHQKGMACSMYKLTAEGKTMVGCNEDAWRTTSRIWFVNANTKIEYGAAFTGSRQVGPNQFAPQSGMNEAGLTFSRLTSHFPKKNILTNGKKEITNEVTYLTDILHKCGTIEEVKHYIEQYDHSLFIDDVFIYIDRSGKYLVVEPYDLIEGDEPYYILSNFCPSITNNEKARKLERYRNGEEFLKTHEPNTSLSFCTSVSDTMHVCRNRNGDGTLLTSIWDTKYGLINLYFYHSFDATVQFNLSEELVKGDHIFNVAELFPPNAEFERLANYVTPFNTPSLRVTLVIIGGILCLLSFVFIVVFLRKRKTLTSYKILLAASLVNLMLTVYLSVLATNINLYYFDAPYEHYSSSFISASSYFPFLLLLSFIPILKFTIRFLKENKTWVKGLLLLNNLIYVSSIIGFGYWGLFNFLA